MAGSGVTFCLVLRSMYTLTRMKPGHHLHSEARNSHQSASNPAGSIIAGSQQSSCSMSTAHSMACGKFTRTNLVDLKTTSCTVSMCLTILSHTVAHTPHRSQVGNKHEIRPDVVEEDIETILAIVSAGQQGCLQLHKTMSTVSTDA